jgi:hypothetical protein
VKIVFNPFTGTFDFINSSGSGGDIIVVTNYSALPVPNTVTGNFYWVSNSQGTSWLPGSIGGTYYSAGLYYSNGVTWEYMNVPYQASQVGVNAGIITDQFITPFTFQNSTQLASKIPNTRTININGNSYNLSADREWRTSQADTGLLSFNSPGITVASGTQVNISIATGYIIDNETNPDVPVYTYVNYAGALNITVPTIVGGPSSYVMLGIGGIISFQNTFPTSTERKAKVWLGKIAHPAGIITGAINEPDYITSPMSFSRDLFQAFGPYINSGIYPSSNGANTNMNISSGYIHGNGISFVGSATNRQDPNRLPNGAGTAVNFAPRTRSSTYTPVATNSIDCSLYDDGTGVGGAPVTIPGAVTRATIRYIYAVPTSTAVGYLVQYGQAWYNSLTDAISAVGRETQVILPNLPGNSILIGVLVARKDATALNDLSQAQFFFADKVGQINGATAGISVSTMQSTYYNSVAPQITTTTLLGGIYNRRGSAADTDIVFGIQNGAGVPTATFNGNGLLESSGGANFSAIGKGKGIKVGANGRLFTATLVLGTVTVLNTSITVNSKPFINLASGGASGTLGVQYNWVCTAGQIVITSLTTGGVAQTLDTSTLQVYLIEGL